MIRSTLILSLLLLLLPRAAEAEKRPFHLSPVLGISAGGKVFSAETTDEEFRWFTPTGENFLAERVQVELDEDFLVGLRVGKGLTDRLSADLSLVWTSMNMSVEAVTFRSNFDTRNYDQMSATFVDAALTWDWVDQRTTPYLVGGVGFASLGFEERRDSAFDLDQSGFSWTLGGGFRWGPLSAEVRDHMVPIDLDEEEARLGAEEFDGKEVLHVWEVSVQLQAGF